MKKKRLKIHKTVNFKIFVPTISVVLAQSLGILLILVFGVGVNTLDPALIDNFESSINLRKNYMETSMSNKWANLSDFYDKLMSDLKVYLNTKGIGAEELLKDKSSTSDFLLTELELFPDLIERNHVNDAFLVLDTSYSDEKETVYLRAKNPLKSDYSEIEVIYSPYKVFNAYYEMGLNLSSKVDTNKYSDIANKEFYAKTVNAAYGDIELDKPTSGYWTCTLNVSSNQVLTYSLPLVYGNKVLGVLGVGLTEQYLRNYMNEISKGESLSVALLKKSADSSQTAFNAFFDYSLPDLSTLSLDKTSYENVYSFKSEGKDYFYYEDEINVYNGNSSLGEEWFVAGVSEKNVILAASNTLLVQVSVVLSVAFLLTLIGLVVISERISKPIRRVSKAINDENLTDIPVTGIAEVDTLLDKVETSVNENVELHDKVSHILEDSSTKMAFFEFSKEKDEIVVTSNFYKMLKLDYNDGKVSSAEFLARLDKLEPMISGQSYESLAPSCLVLEGYVSYIIDSRFIQLKITPTKNGSYATLIDLTEEYQAKQEVEKERDHDILTGLLSRRGFLNKIHAAMEGCQNGSLFMIDVDNLKLINDRYGHEFGDAYLRKIGSYLLNLSQSRSRLLAGHISGDEFILYFYDYPSLEEENALILDLQKIANEYVFFKGNQTHISFSAGVCRFEEGVDLQEMRNRADFAMYEAKRSGKNKIVLFDDEEYEEYKKQNLLYEELNEIISKKLLNYAYQPIVDLNSGEVLGYEALMRAALPDMTPLKIIEAAKKYNRLYDIEYLTFTLASEKYLASKTSKKLFVNSISSQLLSDVAWDEFKKSNKGIFEKLVVEIIEEDFGQSDIMKKKTAILDRNNIDYAIDDYGTGFNNVSMILNYAPKYIKIEGSLIRGIDKDLKRQQFTKTIVSYCKVNGIKIIAEAVETYEELKFVKEAGCDYAQGYFISKPKFEIEDISEELKKTIRKA